MTLVWVCIGIGVYVVGYGLLIIISNIISEGSLYSSWDVIVKEIRYLFNVETIKYILFGIYEILSTIILMISTIYFSLTLTHTKWFRKHRVLIGVIIFLVSDIKDDREFMSKFILIFCGCLHLSLYCVSRISFSRFRLSLSFFS